MKRFTDEVHTSGLALEVSLNERRDDAFDEEDLIEFSFWNLFREIDYLCLKKSQVKELIKYLEELI